MINRLWQMLLGWGTVGVVYQLSTSLQGAGRVITPSFIDRLIPFSASGIWLYLSFFFIVPLGYLCCAPERLRWLRSSMQVTALIAGAIYLLWPTTLIYPENNATSISAQLLHGLMQFDSTQNCLPSLHMALTWLAVWALYDAAKPRASAFYFLWALAIGYSILQLRRHLFIDLATGSALALTVGLCLNRVTRPGQQPVAGKT